RIISPAFVSDGDVDQPRVPSCAPSARRDRVYFESCEGVRRLTIDEEECCSSIAAQAVIRIPQTEFHHRRLDCSCKRYLCQSVGRFGRWLFGGRRTAVSGGARAVIGTGVMVDSDNESPPGGGHGSGGNGGGGELWSPREQDRFLPIANVSRIMKKALPANAKISKDAKETVQECVSEFISFVTGEASDKCQREKRKTINGDDLLWAMTTLGFEEYVEPLKVYLQRFRELEGEKTAGVREKDGGAYDSESSGGGGGGGGGAYGMMPVGQGQHQGHVYGYGGFHQIGERGGGVGGGLSGVGPGSILNRPK
ncbi:hypothetical protein EUGRSUZ_F02051, partial [Eucalyptus grandis]